MENMNKNVIEELDKLMSLMKRVMESIIEWFEGVVVI
jgi:hypothetical protein